MPGAQFLRGVLQGVLQPQGVALHPRLLPGLPPAVRQPQDAARLSQVQTGLFRKIPK